MINNNLPESCATNSTNPTKLSVSIRHLQYILAKKCDCDFCGIPTYSTYFYCFQRVSDFSECSDDSVKDKDFLCEDEADSSDSVDDIPIATSQNTENDPATLITFQKGRPKKGRKRKFENQNRSIKKKRKNSNREYYSANGRVVAPKPFVDFKCSCLSQCHLRASIEDRKAFFMHYWSLGDYNTQTAFIKTCVVETEKKRNTGKDPARRKFSRIYYINKTAVCRELFVKTLRISTKRVNTSLMKVRNLSIPDKRGVAGGHNKMTLQQKDAIIAHIKKFPRYKSHYCRETKNNQEFLPIGVTVTLMHKLYQEEHDNSVSLTAYRNVFLTEFNLKTKLPKKDTCNRCDRYDAKIKSVDEETKKTITSEHKQHLLEAEIARQKMNADLAYAEENEDTETITFDMEKTLPLPRLSTNIIYYKRQLWLYNCGVYAGKHKSSVFHLWLEGQAGRGAQEVGSCLRKYVKQHVSLSVKYLNLWSDSCGGQNRNIKMVLILKCILEESDSLEEIRLNFLVSGHSFLPNDSDFGDVECAIKKQQKLYSPNDYAKIMKTCRKKNPITVNFMEKEDFISTRKIEKEITNRKKSVLENKINWLRMKQIKIVKDKPYSIFIKSDYEGNTYEEINIKKGKGRIPTSRSHFCNNLESLWPHGKAIPTPKLKDIKSYLDLIPAVDQAFYTTLTGDESIDEDIEGYNGGLDFEWEGQRDDMSV